MWLILSLLSAVTSALEGVYQKKGTLHYNVFIITWSILAISSLCYLPMLLYVGIPSNLSLIFWIAVVARLVIDSVALVLYIQVLKTTDLSTAMPMMASHGVFLIFISFFINNLFPGVLGLVGVLVIFIGIYFLHFDHNTKHILSPFKALKHDKGIQLVLLVSFLWSIVVALVKLGIDNSNIYFYTAFFQLVWAICFLPIAFFANRKEFISIFKLKSIKILLPIGFLDTIAVLANNMALGLALPVFVQSIISTNIFFAAVFGFFFFKEQLNTKWLPIVVIILGMILITISQNWGI